jgi:uncharacterized protein involved in exopolysaccharide biosynthesis
MLAVGIVLLRWRRLILVFALAGGALGFIVSLSSARKYVVTATFIPQTSEGGGASSGLAAVASQFGVRAPGGDGSWGPPLYVELFRTRTLLDPIANDTISVAEEGNRRVAVAELLGVKAVTAPRRADIVVNALRAAIEASEIKPLNAVRISVTTKWPSVSLVLTERLVKSINLFNLQTRQSQARAEREFVETQAVAAERALREAENNLQEFLQRNRTYASSPELSFTFTRLGREVALRQQVYNALLVSRGEARIREVRDTPVITVIDGPRLPLVSESRQIGLHTALSLLAGGVLGVLIALAAHALSMARRDEDEPAREFFRLLDEATPRRLRRGVR